MKLIANFAVRGAPVPWSAPDLGFSSRGGSFRRFARRNPRLEAWKEEVAKAAREAMARVSIATGPVQLDIVFYRATPPGKRHGDWWESDVQWNEEKQAWVKRGTSTADITNLVKATEDAMEGVTYANDVQTVSVRAKRVYGPEDGAVISLYAVGPAESMAYGDPIPEPKRARKKVSRPPDVRGPGDPAPEPRRRRKRDEGRADQVGVAHAGEDGGEVPGDPQAA